MRVSGRATRKTANNGESDPFGGNGLGVADSRCASAIFRGPVSVFAIGDKKLIVIAVVVLAVTSRRTRSRTPQLLPDRQSTIG